MAARSLEIVSSAQGSGGTVAHRSSKAYRGSGPVSGAHSPTTTMKRSDGAVASTPRERGEFRRRGDQRGHLRIVDDVADLIGKQLMVDRHVDAAGHRRAELSETTCGTDGSRSDADAVQTREPGLA